MSIFQICFNPTPRHLDQCYIIIISKPNALTQNPIPKNFDHRLWKEANNKKDIIDYTNYFIKMSKSKKALIKKISLNERKNFFTIPNKKNVRNFLDL